ncbi:thiamin biosynthesis protein ThiC [Vibrio maritimus]|uniref:Thiamin biosynthesis protein ThiC n=3 Tax=Vibrionaceae TaxID=641 RepID=A0A090S748_9VIBR|nr:thiamin biosynthesis protein ThiC [Vibrio maritimus]GAL29369.1 thiamin biosynthesis protein ThiC [Vibrio variabilis]
MKISQEVREYAKDYQSNENIEVKLIDDPLEGMRQKSQEFRATGAELYHPAVTEE